MNDRNAFIVGEKVCGQCSGKYTFCLMVIRIQHNSFQFTNISGKLSACANSGYQALSFPAHREPGYEASVHLSRERW